MTTATLETLPVPDLGDSDAGGRKLCIICSKGSLDMAYPGLILANAALGEGIETHIFFTFWGFDIITKKTMDHLKFSPVGNPATHMSPMLMGLPGMTSFATHMMKQQIEGIDVPPVGEFLEMISDAGAHLWGCRMSADMQHLEIDDLYDRVEGIISAADFIDLSEGAQTIFV
ncbi:MAG: DsrE/DsrF/DrsH-like family protein [Acidimicrobiia bacterium]